MSFFKKSKQWLNQTRQLKCIESPLSNASEQRYLSKEKQTQKRQAKTWPVFRVCFVLTLE